MPCLKYACEFCNQEFRRDAMGVHVKAKHENDIIHLLIKDCIDETMKSTIHRIINFNTSIPVYSKLYDGGRYFFGQKPMFFPDDEKDEIAIPYIKNELNMEEHKKYLFELIHKISLGDYVDVLIQLEIVSPKGYIIQKENGMLKKEIMELKEEIQMYIRQAKCALENYQELKKACELNDEESIFSIKQQNAYLLKHRNSNERELQHIKERLETIQTEHEEEIALINRAHTSERDKQWEIEDVLRKELATIKEKHKSELEKAVEKAIKKEKEKRKKKEEQKKKKEKAKKKAMKVAMAKNESDSDNSGSDSDSSDSDSD